MNPFDFLYEGAGRPPSAVQSWLFEDQNRVPRTRRDAATIANQLPNSAPASAPPTPLGPPPVQQQMAPPQMPPSQPQPQPQNPVDALAARFPDVKRPDFLERLANATPSVAGGLNAIFGDGDDLYYDRLAKRAQIEQYLGQIDRGNQAELGSGTGIYYDRTKPLGADDPAWGNVSRVWELQNKYARGGAGSKRGAEGAQTMVDPQTGQTYYTWVEQDELGNAKTRAIDLNNRPAPEDVTRRLSPTTIANSYVKGDIAFTNKQVEEIVSQADAAEKSNSALKNMRETFQGGAAQGFGGDVQRWFMDNIGMDIGSLNVADKQVFETSVRQLEGQLTKQILGGQGQITEGERKIIRDMLPTLRTNPKAFETIMSIYEGHNRRAIATDKAWFNYRGRLGPDADYTQFKRVLNAVRGRGDEEAYQLFEQWSSDGNLNALPDWVYSKPSKNAPGYDKSPPANTPAPPPPGPASGTAVGPNGQRYKWERPVPPPPGSTKVPIGPFGGSITVTPSTPPPPPIQQPQSFRPGLQTGGVGGPEEMGPPPREMSWAPRFEGDPEVGVYSSAPLPAAPSQSLLNTPRERLINASRASQRGQEFNRTATQAKEIAKLMKKLPSMSPAERAKTEAYLKSLGLIQ